MGEKLHDVFFAVFIILLCCFFPFCNLDIFTSTCPETADRSEMWYKAFFTLQV